MSNKNRLTHLILVAVLGAFLTACGANPASSGVKIRIGVDATLPPFETVSAGGQDYTGFDIDLMRAIAASAGFDVEFVNLPMNQLLTGVLNCTVDGGISAIPITDQLKQQLVFSNPYLTLGQVVVVKKGNLVIGGREQLPGMVVGALANSAAATDIQQMTDVQLAGYPSFALAFQDLVAGNIDAVVTSKPRAVSFTTIPANNLKIVGAEFSSEAFGIAVCGKQTGLLSKINTGLDTVKANGVLDNLLKKWKIQSVK